MFAIIRLGGNQYRVHEKDELEVQKLDIEDGKNFKVTDVLLMAEEDGSQVKIGTPFVVGAHVECQVIDQIKGDKIRVFKFHAKKHYHRTQGHRQRFTNIKILKISAVEKKAVAPKEEMMEEKVVEADKPTKTEKAPKAVKKAPAKKAVKKA